MVAETNRGDKRDLAGAVAIGPMVPIYVIECALLVEQRDYCLTVSRGRQYTTWFIKRRRRADLDALGFVIPIRANDGTLVAYSGD